MSQNVYDVLQERGFIAQTTHEELRELLGKEKVTFYIGFDATADSLTAGHFLTIMAMMHMQKAGHRPIALLGGGTTMIGDPSGKSDKRNMLTKETIDHNAIRFKEQLSRFIKFELLNVILGIFKNIVIKSSVSSLPSDCISIYPSYTYTVPP